MSIIQHIADALARDGLRLRGGFDFAPGEEAPPGHGGTPAGAVLLVGHAGGEYWQHFAAWRARLAKVPAHPLDQWAAERIGAVAQACNARAVFPSDRPYLPFQLWAKRAEGLRSSPIGMLIHPEYGLWHAFRGALLFDRRLELPAPVPRAHPCDDCRERPCLSACPIGAHGEGGFAVDACRAYLAASPASACRASGCLARNACPVGPQWRLPAEAQAFHLARFAKLA